jgi:hypothetical protein
LCLHNYNLYRPLADSRYFSNTFSDSLPDAAKE